MRAVLLGLAALVAAPLSETDRTAATAAADQVDEVVAKTREALGGSERLDALQALIAEGPFRRAMGPSEIEGTITLTLGLPDRLRQEEQLSLPNGATVSRLSGLNGEHAWEDTASRGGTGGGSIIVRGGASSLGDRDLPPEERRRLQQQRLAARYQRMALALLASGDGMSYAGMADVDGRETHVLEVLDPEGHPLLLLIDHDTFRPIALSYMDVRPAGAGMMAAGGGPRSERRGGGARGSGRTRGEVVQSAPSTVIMRLEDYRAVDGIQLPHVLVQTVDGEPVEEWTIERYALNPQLEPGTFDRK